MSRQQLLPRCCLTIALGIVVFVAPVQSWSQDRSTEERLDRVERDLNMLQRQVYRGAPPPPMAGDPSAAVSIEIRMDRLEAQMRDLTGRVEEVTNQLDQVRQRVEQINSDVEMRLGQGSGAVAAANPPPGRPGPAGPGRTAFDFPPPPGDQGLAPPGMGSSGPGSLTPPGEPPRGPTPIFGTLQPPGSGPPPPELTSAAPTGRPPAHGTLPNGSPAEQYNYAFGLLKRADYPAAETALKAFVEQHPKDRLAGNAQYWLGETYYTRGRYLEAASAFAEGYKRYPKGAKASEDLLKLGMSLGRANQKQNACLAFAQLDHDFPHAGAAVKERATAEKKHLGC